MEILKNMRHSDKAARLASARMPGLSENSAAEWIIGSNNIDERQFRLDPVEPATDLLVSNRIVAFDGNQPASRWYDLLRNHIRSDRQSGPMVAVSGCSSGCGTTTTAINMAMSFARLPNTRVLLVDANSNAPGLARTLGLPPALPSEDPHAGSLSTIEAGGATVFLLRTAREIGATRGIGELQRMTSQIDAARAMLVPSITFIDLPPLLGSDDVLPLVDLCGMTLLVAAVGETKRADLTACLSYLGKSHKTQVILNKTIVNGL